MNLPAGVMPKFIEFDDNIISIDHITRIEKLNNSGIILYIGDNYSYSIKLDINQSAKFLPYLREFYPVLDLTLEGHEES